MVHLTSIFGRKKINGINLFY